MAVLDSPPPPDATSWAEQRAIEATPSRAHTANPLDPQSIPAVDGWQQEEVLINGDAFFDRVRREIESAEHCVDIETYIFATNAFAQEFADLLCRTAKRGVRVRVMADGVGSMGWTGTYAERFRAAGVLFKTYHDVLPTLSKVLNVAEWHNTIKRILEFGNKRTHRKLYLIDRRRALVGSMNVTGVHCRSFEGDAAWRDTGIFVTGRDVAIVQSAFDGLWNGWEFLGIHRSRPILGDSSALVRLNRTRRERRQNRLDLLLRLRRARKRVWVTNAYFVPHISIIRALRLTARRGIDVRIILPRKSDVVFMPWVHAAFYDCLTEARIKLYEYAVSPLHAKTMIIDDWATIGSSNLNHRSILHDLECDVVVTHETSLVTLEQQFQRDCEVSLPIGDQEWQNRPLWQRTMGRVCGLMKYFL